MNPVAIDPAILHALTTSQASMDGAGEKSAGKSFSSVLTDFVQETEELQKASEVKVDDFVAGKVDDVHDVVAALNQADLSFRMMIEVRNKLMEAYQEVMRTPV